ncbi:chaperonin GroES [Marinitoga hydrogenitolerans DSM 16785]|uniref:Co-chaperonin GroES n=1 Tax=Marinitoga hydrogenitolerans (strain DSM 16785 / JCM 12826 / AT1271) TaxID=1122195 RepID=A0A1M4XYI8_MARH1|nr:co-chaperone GroES [Marinitoga hydrogenitolerans]SHE98510.1 chaperonin GroES [Marinitoga hydrogenitolerans DSM 16785]
MKVRPLGNRLLIKPVIEEKKTEGGIVLPDTAKEKPMRAEVVAVGNIDDDVEINVGDHVIFAKYSGTEIKIDDEDYILIDVDDILAKYED